MRRSSPSVERVVNSLPQLQVTLMVVVVGVDIGFHCLSPHARGRAKRPRNINASARCRKPPWLHFYPQKLWISLWKKIERVPKVRIFKRTLVNMTIL